MSEPRPVVQLTGEDGNAFFIIGKVRKALRDSGASSEYINQFMEDSMSGDYDHVLQTVFKYAEVN